MTITELQKFQDCTVVIRTNDGEVLRGKVLFVDFEYEDIVVDVFETNRPEPNNEARAAVYAVKAGDVVSIQREQA